MLHQGFVLVGQDAERERLGGADGFTNGAALRQCHRQRRRIERRLLHPAREDRAGAILVTRREDIDAAGNAADRFSQMKPLGVRLAAHVD